MAKSFKALEAKMSPQARTRAKEQAIKLAGEMALDELRVAMDITQEHLASLLRVNQSAISKMERRTDMYISTLQHFVRAMGGDLEIRAVFSEGAVTISQFQKLREKQPVRGAQQAPVRVR